MLRLLLVCAVISIVFDMAFAEGDHLKTGTLIFIVTKKFIAWVEGACIFVAVFVVAFVGSYNDYKKEE